MVETTIETDLSELETLPADARRAIAGGLHATTERGAEIMREEVPVGETKRLKEGITPSFNERTLIGEIQASAIRPATPERTITSTNARGRATTARFSAQPEFDYALAVAEGTGLYGPRKREIRAKDGGTLHFFIGGREIFARSVKGARPNPYPERTARRLLSEAQGILERIMGAQLA